MSFCWKNIIYLTNTCIIFIRGKKRNLRWGVALLHTIRNHYEFTLENVQRFDKSWKVEYRSMKINLRQYIRSMHTLFINYWLFYTLNLVHRKILEIFLYALTSEEWKLEVTLSVFSLIFIDQRRISWVILFFF